MIDRTEVDIVTEVPNLLKPRELKSQTMGASTTKTVLRRELQEPHPLDAGSQDMIDISTEIMME